MTDPEPARRAYKDYAAEAGRRLSAAQEARRRLAEAEEERTAAYASVEEEWARLDRLEDRAAGIWRELTTRFGPQATGGLPEPADPPKGGQDPEEPLRDAHRRAREPVEYPLAGRFALMVALGFGAAAAVAALGLELAGILRELGKARLAAAYGPVVAAPFVGHQVAKAWIRLRTSYEEREYAIDTAVAGAIGGGGVWLIAVILLVVHIVT